MLEERTGFDDQTRLARLNELRCGRAKASFGRAIGIEARQYIARVFEEDRTKELSPEDLKMLSLAENVNLGWYITGAGPKYVVHHHHATSEFKATIQTLVQEYESFWMIADKDSDDTEQRQVVLISLNSSEGYPKISIHVGQPSISLIALFKPKTVKGHLVPTVEFEKLVQGEYGTFHLLGGEKAKGFLDAQDEISLDWIIGNLPRGNHLEVNDLPSLFHAYEETKTALNRINGSSQTSETTIADMAMALYRSGKSDKKNN